MALDALPLDILDVLCTFLDTDALRALALTHSVFHPFTQRRIFRHVALYTYPQAARCLRALRREPARARAVRTFSLRLDPKEGVVLRPFAEMLARALQEMTNLTALDVVLPPSCARVFDCDDDAGDTALRTRTGVGAEAVRTTYPRLAHFSCNVPLVPPIRAFLLRTPALNELALGEGRPGGEDAFGLGGGGGSSRGPSASTLALPASALPCLSLFTGSCEDAAALVPGRPLESVHLCSGELTEDVLGALARSSSPITIFGALTNALSPSILHALAATLPHLHHLRIMTMYHSASHPDDIFYSQVVRILTTLPELVTAELAGIRWAPWKKQAGGTRPGTHANRLPRSRSSIETTQ